MKNQMSCFVAVMMGCFGAAMSATASVELSSVSIDDNIPNQEVFFQANGPGRKLPRYAIGRDIEGKPVFDVLPVVRSVLWSQSQRELVQYGDYVDVNADGMMDFVVSYFELDNHGLFYRATFINNGKNWTMSACSSNYNWPENMFPSCN